MNEQLINMMDKLPPWLIWVAAFFFLLIKWGPGFMLKYIEVSNKMRNKSEAIKKEYIADLENQVRRLKKQIEEEKK